MRAILVVICLATVPGSSIAATPAERLLDVLLADISEPSHRCHWFASHTDELERTLSLYRRQRPRLLAHADRRLIADTAGNLRSAVFEARLVGPTTVTLRLDDLRGRLPVKAGQQLEVALVDSSGAMHPMFCGIVFASHRQQDPNRVVVSALIPRPGRELARSRQFTDVRRREAIEILAEEAGLTLMVEDSASHPALSSLNQRNVADWLFMRDLAGAEAMDLTLSGSGLRYATSAFTGRATAFAPRLWHEMTWVDVVRAVADETGVPAEVEVVQSPPTRDFTQTIENLPFAHDLAAAHEHSAFLEGARLVVRDDGAWRRHPERHSSRRFAARLEDLARSIAERHGYALEIRGVSTRPSKLTHTDQTDSEFLLSVLADRELRLEHTGRGLLLRAPDAPGDVADLLLSRVIVNAGGTAGRLSRRYGDVRSQLIRPWEVPSSTLTLELGAARPSLGPGPTRLSRKPSAPKPTPLPAAADVTRTTRLLDRAISRSSAAAGTARETFLVDLAQVYRPTLVFLYQGDARRQQKLAELANRP